MQKEVIIFFSTSQNIYETGKDDFEIIVPGQYYEKNGKFYLLFDDEEEDTGHLIHTTIRITKDRIEVMRHGDAHVHMTFEKGQKNYSLYQTPFGEMMVGFETDDIEFETEEHKMFVRIEYRLEIEGKPTSDCAVVIRAESKDFCKINLSSDGE